jgi:non-homologous end joining protein Ku
LSFVLILQLKADTFQRQQKKLFTTGIKEFVDAVEVHKIWNSITSHLIPVVELVKCQTYSCYVLLAIEVNQIVAIAKFTIEKLEAIVVIKRQIKSQQVLWQNSALEQQKKEPDVKIGQQIKADVVIYINNF